MQQQHDNHLYQQEPNMSIDSKDQDSPFKPHAEEK